MKRKLKEVITEIRDKHEHEHDVSGSIADAYTAIVVVTVNTTSDYLNPETKHHVYMKKGFFFFDSKKTHEKSHANEGMAWEMALCHLYVANPKIVSSNVLTDVDQQLPMGTSPISFSYELNGIPPTLTLTIPNNGVENSIVLEDQTNKVSNVHGSFKQG